MTTRRIGAFLRAWADRLDPDGAPQGIGWSFTFERGEGIRFRDDGRGCPLWHINGDTDYDRAHTESDSRPPRIDWKTMTVAPYPTDTHLRERA